MSCLTCIWATRNQSLKRCHGSVSVFWHVTSNKNTLKDITDLVPDGNIETTPPCELSDLRSVGACINKIKASGNKFDALIFNAGIDGAPFQKTAQGHELHFAVNHLSHFALWNGLIFGLKQWPFCFFSNLLFVFWLSLNMVKWHIKTHQIAMACSVRLVGRLYFSPHTKNQERRGEGRPSRCFCNLICSSRCRSWSLRFDLGEEAACHSNGSKVKINSPMSN